MNPIKQYIDDSGLDIHPVPFIAEKVEWLIDVHDYVWVVLKADAGLLRTTFGRMPEGGILVTWCVRGKLELALTETCEQAVKALDEHAGPVWAIADWRSSLDSCA